MGSIVHRHRHCSPARMLTGAGDYPNQLTIVCCGSTEPACTSSAPPVQSYSGTILHFNPGRGAGEQSRRQTSAWPVAMCWRLVVADGVITACLTADPAAVRMQLQQLLQQLCEDFQRVTVICSMSS